MTKTFVGGKSVVKNAARNLLGQGLPLIVAFFCIPQLITTLGAERFGFLTLIWVVVGYLSIFDLGLGRALTKLVAEKIGRGQHDEIPPLFWTAMWLMAGLGMVGIVIAEIVIPYLVEGVFKLPKEFKNEARDALSVAVLSIPFVIISTGSRGVIEAHQRFDLVNWLRIPLGVFTYAAPLLVAHYLSNELSAIAMVLLVGRFFFLCGTLWLCFKIIPALRQVQKIQNVLLKPLFSFGGWMTLTNLISPMMVYLDRFVIGALVSMSAVAYYVTPYEMITKLWILPNALVGALFSAFAINRTHHAERLAKMFRNAINGIFLMLLPIIILVVTFANEGLTLWLGADFAIHATKVLQILTIGVLINSFAQVPFVFIQAAGRPDITAKLHAIELPLYLAGLWFLLLKWSVEGAAIAWVARIFLDNVFLLIVCGQLMPELNKSVKRGIVLSLSSCIVLPFLIFVHGVNGKISVVTVALVISVVAAYWFKGHWHRKQSFPIES